MSAVTERRRGNRQRGKHTKTGRKKEGGSGRSEGCKRVRQEVSHDEQKYASCAIKERGDGFRQDVSSKRGLYFEGMKTERVQRRRLKEDARRKSFSSLFISGHL